MSLFVQNRGALSGELHRNLRTHWGLRRRAGSQRLEGQGHILNMVNISQRPVEIDDRAIQGYLEGDLIKGRCKTAIGTLVERITCYEKLFALEKPTTESVRVAMTGKIMNMSGQLRKSLTWDKGSEMSQHQSFNIGSEIQI